MFHPRADQNDPGISGWCAHTMCESINLTQALKYFCNSFSDTKTNARIHKPVEIAAHVNKRFHDTKTLHYMSIYGKSCIFHLKLTHSKTEQIGKTFLSHAHKNTSTGRNHLWSIEHERRPWLEPISANVISPTHAISLRDWILMPAVFQCGSIIWQGTSPDAYQCLDSFCSPSADISSTSGIPKKCSIHTCNSNTYTHHSAVFLHICTVWTHTRTHTHTHSSICFNISAY